MSKIHLFIFIALLIYLASIRVYLHKEAALPRNQPIKFEAIVKREPRIYDMYQVVYVADSKVYVDLYPRFRVGDRLLVEGKLDEKGRMFKGKVEKNGEVSSLTRLRSRLRENISQKISRLLPIREATLVTGTVLGVDRISAEFREELVKTGTIHVVVVSGQNLSIVAAMFLAQVRFVGRRRSMVLAVLAVFAYAFLTGFEPPVIRASIMVLVSTLAVYLGREADALWSLFIAATAIVLIWPHAIFEISFQLTFAATLGIMTLGQLLKARLGRFGLLGNNAAIATSAYIFTAPIILFYFGQVSPIAPIANIFVAEAVFPIMVLGFLTATATLIFMPLAQVLAYLAFVTAMYFTQVVAIMAKIN